MRSLFVLFVSTLGLMACQRTVLDPASSLSEEASETIPGEYIVVLNDTQFGNQALSRTNLSTLMGVDLGTGIKHVFNAALKGFSGRLEARTLEVLQRSPKVAFIEADQVVRSSATQTNATWGLDRIDQRNLPLNGAYSYTSSGAGVNAYVIDTGIRQTHQEFSERIGTAYDAVTTGGTGEDCNGHGTHVAGTLGGSSYGVAKGVTLHAVRVLGCEGSGSNSDVIEGINWVTANRVQPAVANLSLGGGPSRALDQALTASINAGVTYAVAAGNSSANACRSSPARAPGAITVGASTNQDARASYSNVGPCLDVFAPGSDITSAWDSSDTASKTISGTSMASPHVAGAAALYLERNPNASPSTVAGAISSQATTNVLSGVGAGSPNRLLFAQPVTGTPQEKWKFEQPLRRYTTNMGAFTAKGEVRQGAGLVPDSARDQRRLRTKNSSL